jgi:hypothetical protein
MQSAHRFLTLPLSACSTLFRFGLRTFPSRLVTAYGRITFVILRTGVSLPVAPHHAFRHRSYVQVRAGERMPGEVLPLTVSGASQAHWGGTACSAARQVRQLRIEFGT